MKIGDYIASTQEEAWYEHWIKNTFFRSVPVQGKDPYVVILPPPNITGELHVGHVLNATTQDVLVRKARMEGKETCWVPGLDHASIATETKVLAMLREKGIEKKDLSREEFLTHAWAWKEKYGGIILEQLRKIGVSCDWERLRFTMEPKLSDSVTQAFVSLYDAGYIYRGYRMVHWDPKGLTALSDDEVIHKEVQGHFYHIQYPLVGEEGHYVTVATTRPETLLGDVALCVHPEDERFQHLIGKKALVPLINREIPIIADTYVDPTLGTGCLKITPAHDANDYNIGQKHNLPIIEILNPDGTLHPRAERYIGEDRFVARKKIAEDLSQAGLLTSVKDHVHQVGFSERTNVVIEPRLSTQWFVTMQPLAKPALESVEKGEIRFYPDKFRNTYNYWLKNVRDWCISRQLWWGHRIPAYYLPDGRFVVAETPEKALEKAHLLTGNNDLTPQDLTQDNDVLDTWFSSWLWPMTVFDGMISPENADYNYYYPTDDLVTGSDIIFFWVARMIMAGYFFGKKKPFSNVYFTGLVRDNKGRKMSKSLGNSPNTLALIEKYGADGLRAGMLICTPAGNDLLFDEQLCTQGKKFVHKIWNALTLVTGWAPDEQAPQDKEEIAIQWFQAQYTKVVEELTQCLTEFRISEAFIHIYKLIWDDFCGQYLEMIKPEPGANISAATYQATLTFFEDLMKVLHPFMPFITEEVWHKLKPRTDQESICIQTWPTPTQNYNKATLSAGDYAFTLIKKIRRLRREYNVNSSTRLTLVIRGEKPRWLTQFEGHISKQGKIQNIAAHPALGDGIGFVVDTYEFSLAGVSATPSEATQQRLAEDLAYQKGFLASVEKKLSNEQFLAKAPEHLVALERKKQSDAQERIKALKQLLAVLQS